jgi:hypothetical protein
MKAVECKIKRVNTTIVDCMVDGLIWLRVLE